MSIKDLSAVSLDLRLVVFQVHSVFGTQEQKLNVLNYFESKGGLVPQDEETPAQRHSEELKVARFALLMSQVPEIVQKIGALDQLGKISLYPSDQTELRLMPVHLRNVKRIKESMDACRP
jgi:hypothetical protein